MAKETLRPNGLSKDQGISPLALKKIADITPKMPDNMARQPALSEIREMTQNQIEQRADELGLSVARYTVRLVADYTEKRYKVTMPTRLPLLRYRTIFNGPATNHIEAERRALEILLNPRAKQNPRDPLIPETIDVVNESFHRSLITLLLGKKYAVSALTTSRQRAIVAEGRFRNRKDAREKAIRNIRHMNRKIQG